MNLTYNWQLHSVHGQLIFTLYLFLLVFLIVNLIFACLRIPLQELNGSENTKEMILNRIYIMEVNENGNKTTKRMLLCGATLQCYK